MTKHQPRSSQIPVAAQYDDGVSDITALKRVSGGGTDMHFMTRYREIMEVGESAQNYSAHYAK